MCSVWLLSNQLAAGADRKIGIVAGHVYLPLVPRPVTRVAMKLPCPVMWCKRHWNRIGAARALAL
jgi:hypothetical protein